MSDATFEGNIQKLKFDRALMVVMPDYTALQISKCLKAGGDGQTSFTNGTNSLFTMWTGPLAAALALVTAMATAIAKSISGN